MDVAAAHELLDLLYRALRALAHPLVAVLHLEVVELAQQGGGQDDREVGRAVDSDSSRWWFQTIAFASGTRTGWPGSGSNKAATRATRSSIDLATRSYTCSVEAVYVPAVLPDSLPDDLLIPRELLALRFRRV